MATPRRRRRDTSAKRAAPRDNPPRTRLPSWIHVALDYEIEQTGEKRSVLLDRALRNIERVVFVTVRDVLSATSAYHNTVEVNWNRRSGELNIFWKETAPRNTLAQFFWKGDAPHWRCLSADFGDAEAHCRAVRDAVFERVESMRITTERLIAESRG
jgi:hypothetical protein